MQKQYEKFYNMDENFFISRNNLNWFNIPETHISEMLGEKAKAKSEEGQAGLLIFILLLGLIDCFSVSPC